MVERPRNVNVKVIFGLALVHFIGDFYISFINPLLPVFVEKFSLSLAQVGLLAGISRILAFFVQPWVGYLADHYRTRFFILGGPLIAIVFIPLVGIAPCFWALILFTSLGSIGGSMFHPTSAGMVSNYSGRHFGFSMSIFNMGGALAIGVGPLFITYFVSSYGLEISPLTMIVGLMVMIFLIKIIPLSQEERLGKLGFIDSIKKVLGTVWKSIILIWVIMVLRGFVSQSFLAFIPVMYATEGYSLVSIGKIVSIYSVAGSISGLIAGHVSDRIGYKPVFYIAQILATPSLYLLLYLPGNWVYFSAFIAGFFIMASVPLGVVMAQELAPKGRSMVSSLMMGFAYGTGGMMIALAGKMADIFSIQGVLTFLAMIPFLTSALIFFLPDIKRK